ncbi:hypothetical protein NBCG_00575 [Nocardioidaceae bacterium Broad-1]|nr:hypothetical protein NBCG_00575 [Nocardioidaceae bacterium Broad-1]
MSDSEDLAAIFAREDAARLLDAQRRMQHRVASYAQLTAGGLSRVDVERAVRRNELRRVHPRVYIDHTGPLTWEQRAWAAVLTPTRRCSAGTASRRPGAVTTVGRSMSRSTTSAG